jgi:hypothetical protein
MFCCFSIRYPIHVPLHCIAGFLTNFLDRVQYFIKDETDVNGNITKTHGRTALHKQLEKVVEGETEELWVHVAA